MCIRDRVRRALEKEPDNIEYMMKHAEILTELSKYEESNSVLFEVLMKTKEARSECFFGMGCNFIGLGDLDKAEESFEKYLAVSPDGEYRDDVEEFLALFCDMEEEEEYILEDANNLKQQELAEEGKRHLDNCEYQKAVEVLEKIDTKDPDTVSYTHLRAHETGRNLVCRLLLEKKKKITLYNVNDIKIS